MKMIKYEKCCRTCLKEDNVLMFDLFMETLESRNNNITDILVSCAKLQVSTYIVPVCIILLNLRLFKCPGN